MTDLIKHRVDSGARFLDYRQPGWPTRINTSTLFINSPINCVLGQLYGDYQRGKQALGINAIEAEQLGFTFESERVPETNALYTNAWKEEINERLGIEKSGERSAASQLEVPQVV